MSPEQQALISSFIILFALFFLFFFKSEPFSNSNVIANHNPNVVPDPVLSYYRAYDNNAANKPGSWPGPKTMIVGFHYTDWCGYCKRMKPTWDAVKSKLLSNPANKIVFVENNEESNPTEGINAFPTIIKYQNGIADIYRGNADPDRLSQWIMSVSHLESVPTGRMTALQMF